MEISEMKNLTPELRALSSDILEGIVILSDFTLSYINKAKYLNTTGKSEIIDHAKTCSQNFLELIDMIEKLFSSVEVGCHV